MYLQSRYILMQILEPMMHNCRGRPWHWRLSRPLCHYRPLCGRPLCHYTVGWAHLHFAMEGTDSWKSPRLLLIQIWIPTPGLHSWKSEEGDRRNYRIAARWALSQLAFIFLTWYSIQLSICGEQIVLYYWKHREVKIFLESH